jgi:hypothetical protein
MLDLFGVFKIMHAPAAGQQLVEGLRPAQEQQAQQHHLCRHQFQGLVDRCSQRSARLPITSG